VMCVLLLAGWLGSVRWYAGWIGPSAHSVRILAGRVVVENRESIGIFPPARWMFGRRRLQLALRPGWDFGSSAWWVVVPLWMPLVPTLMATATAWRLDTLARRRARIGLCPTCNYDLRGLPAASPCPECGAVPVTW
jgi:hypothetical protein